MKRWKIEHEVENLPCQYNVTIECSQMISMYYNLVALPLILRESHMGFGTFLSYFLRLFSGKKPTAHPIEMFLKQDYNSEENVIQNSMIKVLNALNDDADRKSDISGFELVILLHQNPDESQTKFLTRLQVKHDCKGNDDDIMLDLDSAWTKFVNEEIKGNISPCQNVSFYMDQFGTRNYTRCCQLLDLVRNQSMKAVLKLMKYSIQPALYFEPLDEFLLSYDNLDFLHFNNLTNHTSTFFKRNLKEILMERNPNPRILKCNYASREYPHPENCNLFYNSLTNDGFAYTFNNADFWDMFLETHYANLFSKIMRPKGYKKKNEISNVLTEVDYSNNGIDWVYPKEGIVYPNKSGPKKWACCK